MKFYCVEPYVNSVGRLRYYNGLVSGGMLLQSSNSKGLWNFQVGSKLRHLIGFAFKNFFNRESVVILLSYGFLNKRYFYFFPIRLLFPNATIIAVLFKPQVRRCEKVQFCNRNRIDRVLSPIAKEVWESSGSSFLLSFFQLFPYGYDPTNVGVQMEKKFDVGLTGASHSSENYPEGAFIEKNLRYKILEKFQSKAVRDLSVFFNVSDNANNEFLTTEEYRNVLGSTRVWIVTLSAYGDLTPRFYEALSSGAVVLVEKLPETYEWLLSMFGDRIVEFSPSLDDFGVSLEYALKKSEIAIESGFDARVFSISWPALFETVILDQEVVN